MRWASACVVFATLPLSSPARADGAYGRLAGDLALTGEVGVVASTDGAALAGRLSASYLWMAGVYGDYGGGLGRTAQPVRHRLAAGIDIRPLFLARFANDLERGPGALDLWLDSFGLNLGAYHAWLNDGFCELGCSDHGLEFLWHMGLPLWLRATSPILAVRAGLRWSLDEADPRPPIARPVAMLTIGYQHLFATGLAGKR